MQNKKKHRNINLAGEQLVCSW